MFKVSLNVNGSSVLHYYNYFMQFLLKSLKEKTKSIFGASGPGRNGSLPLLPAVSENVGVLVALCLASLRELHGLCLIISTC